MKFSKETIDKKFSLPKQQYQKKKSVVSHKQSVVYTNKKQTKLNLKS